MKPAYIDKLHNITFNQVGAKLSMDSIFVRAEDGIRGFCLSGGLGDVYKEQLQGREGHVSTRLRGVALRHADRLRDEHVISRDAVPYTHLTLPTTHTVLLLVAAISFCNPTYPLGLSSMAGIMSTSIYA